MTFEKLQSTALESRPHAISSSLAAELSLNATRALENSRSDSTSHLATMGFPSVQIENHAAAHHEAIPVSKDHKADVRAELKPGIHVVEPNDSMWKIAKDHLPPGASPKDILERAKEIAAANGFDDLNHTIHPGDVLKIPGHNKDGGHVAQDHMGNRTTTYPDGSVKQENIDGSGQVKYADGSIHHWGRKPEDNYEVTADGKKIALTTDSTGGVVRTYPDGSKSTTWPDGTVKEENKDGTGLVRKPDGSEHHWGPKKEDNYDVTKDGGKTVTDSDGDKVTKWPNGGERHDNKDGTGFVKNPDGSEHHWGPSAGDNWDKEKDGSIVTKGADGTVNKIKPDGSFETRYPDGSIKIENMDKTVGYVKNADGSEHHWGPRAEQNYDVTKDGGHKTTDSNGNSTIVYPNGAMRYEHADHSGSSWTPNGDGTYKVHHWGPQKSDNYDETAKK